MLPRVLPFIVFAGLLTAFAAMPSTVYAQSDENGALIVTVTDAATGKPIDSASVFLLGRETPESSLTNAKGLLIFEDLQPGAYRLQVQADGYKSSAFTEVEVGDGERVGIAVNLVPTLRIIASITAHASVGVHENIDENSPQRKVSQSLSDALNKLAGVSVDDELYGGDSAFNISLRNQDSSQTALLIDGIHVAGAAAGLAGAASELFSGASVDFAPTAFGSAGSVNFATLAPTKTWNYAFTGEVGNYGFTAGTWAVTGGSGKITTALEHAGAGKDLPLNGALYADQTGRTYEHLGGWARNSNLVKLNLAMSGATNLRFFALSAQSRNASICSDATALLPCGNGPRNASFAHFHWNTMEFESLAGHVQYDLFANAGQGNMDVASPNRAVNGTRVPYFSSEHTPWFSYGFYANTTARRHTVSTGYYADFQATTANSTFNGNAVPPQTASQRNGGEWIRDRVKANDKLALNYAASQSFATGAGSTLEVSGEMTWQSAKTDVFSFSLGAGSANPGPTDPAPLGDALSAQYDCFNQSVYVDGPAQPAVRQASQSYDAGWRHRFKGGFFNVDVYRRNLLGQTFRAAVPIASEPASLFPDGSLTAYLQQIGSTWSEPVVCGSMPFNADRVYVSQMISGLRQISQGITIDAEIPAGKNVVLFPTYAMASAYLSTLDPRLVAPGSYYAAGAQLPHRPLRTAGITVDGMLPRRHAEWLVNAQFTSANNGNNLPAYTLYSAGLVFHGGLGDITVLESNVFGTHTGLFTTYQGVNPMPLQGGGTFALSTTPLPPRSFSVEYRIKWHQREASLVKAKSRA